MDAGGSHGQQIRAAFQNDLKRRPDAFYEPNSFDGPVEDKSAIEPPLRISGDATRHNHRDGNDDYVLVRALFNLFDAGQKQRLYSSYADAMGTDLPQEILERALGYLEKVHPDYAKGVCAALASKVASKAAVE